MKFELKWADLPKNVPNLSPEILIPINGMPRADTSIVK